RDARDQVIAKVGRGVVEEGRLRAVELRVQPGLEKAHADAVARRRREAELQRSRIALEAVAVGVELAELVAGRDRRDAAALLVAERQRVVPRARRPGRADVA